MEIQNSLKTIQSVYPIAGNDEYSVVLNQIGKIIMDKTDNFKDPAGLNKEQIDMKSILQNENISPGDWKKEVGDFQFSEVEAVNWFANQLQNRYINQSNQDDRKMKRIRIVKAKAKARLRMMELQSIVY